MLKKRDGELVLMAVGDIFVNRSDPPSIFTRVAPVLREGDVVFGNLEALNCDRGTPIDGKVQIGSQHLRSAPDNARALESAGFNAMVLANNHNMDYGAEGLLQNIELLDKMNIAHAGGGHNLEAAHRPAIVERNGVKIAILSYTSIFIPGFTAEADKAGLATIKVCTSYQAPVYVQYQPGYAPLMTTIPDTADEERMVNDVRHAKQLADIVVAAFHWGVSWGYGRVIGYQKELGRAAVDAGADLIVGAHPHALQAMEIYKGKLICYCMGNFVMDGVSGAHFGSDTIILKCGIQDRKIKKCSFVPARISEKWEPYILDHDGGMEVMKKMESMSAEFGTIFSMDDGEVVVSGPKPGTPEGLRGLSIEPHRGLPVLVDALVPIPIPKKLMRQS